MIRDEDCHARNALDAWGKILDALPRAKRVNLVREMFCLEGTLNKALLFLTVLRKYFLEIGDEKQPFVVKIDSILGPIQPEGQDPAEKKPTPK